MKSIEEVERSRPQRASAPARPQKSAALEELPSASIFGGSGKAVSADEALEDFNKFVKSLAMSDKLAFLGAALAILTAFFPWRETAIEGDVIGLMSSGIVAVVFNAAAIFTIAARTRRIMPHVQAPLWWLGQLGAVVLALVWCLIFMKTNWDGRQVPSSIGNELMAISRPAFGVFFALLFEIVALAGTVLGLKEKAR